MTLSKAAQTYGMSTEQLGRAMTAFQQIISKGKVSMEELRGQFGEAIPGAMQVAARAYKTNTQALEDMIAKGVDGADFTRRWTAQLASEVPPAADRAGKGIQHLGNEILLLKDRIAQSGVVSFLDTILGKLAKIAEGQRSAEEKARATVLRQLGPAAGTATPGELAEMTETQRKSYSPEDFNQRAVAAIKYRYFEREWLNERKRASTEQANAEKDRLATQETANKELKTGLDTAKTEQEKFNKAASLAPELDGKANGALKEQNTLLEQRLRVNQKSLETATKTMAERPPALSPLRRLKWPGTTPYAKQSATIRHNWSAISKPSRTMKKPAPMPCRSVRRQSARPLNSVRKYSASTTSKRRKCGARMSKTSRS